MQRGKIDLLHEGGAFDPQRSKNNRKGVEIEEKGNKEVDGEWG